MGLPAQGHEADAVGGADIFVDHELHDPVAVDVVEDLEHDAEEAELGGAVDRRSGLPGSPGDDLLGMQRPRRRADEQGHGRGQGEELGHGCLGRCSQSGSTA